ncbi:MAG: hypothetical protein CMC35_08435 [Flavobacteriaceae bacterium]|nr:hypothetical protein [Flavobacteriaceae bacterium]|tara:strand:+ start:23836 stop:24828 length:993 start_codon:yes stop_codon:yes gene_type:complete
MKLFNQITGLVLAGILVSCGASNVEDSKIPQATASSSELVRITDDEAPEFSPKLSKEGQRLLYTTRDDSKSGSERWSIRLKSDVNKPGFSPITDAHCLNPSWHPESKKFLYSYFKGKEPILAISSTESLGITFVAQKGYGEYDNDASYSPDGSRILMSTSIQGKTAIGIVNANGQNFTLIGEGASPVWHPDGEMIAFVKNSGEYAQIYFYNLTNNQITQITSGEFHHLSPTFSPDGSRFVFVSNRDSETFHIYTMRMDGTNLTQLTTGSTTETQPFWGNDGYIYFSSDAGTKKRKTNISGLAGSPLFEIVNFNQGWTYADIWRLKPLLIN